jgi:hypothetical protein
MGAISFQARNCMEHSSRTILIIIGGWNKNALIAILEYFIAPHTKENQATESVNNTLLQNNPRLK